MENARALIENAKIKMAALVAAGAIVLGASGCTTPEDADPMKSPDTSSSQAGAESGLPRVAEHIFAATGAASDNVIKTYDLKTDSNRSKEDYDWLINTQPSDEQPESLPGGATAPILDIKLRKDGKLGYKDHTPETPEYLPSGKQEAKLLKAVNDNKELIEAAMQGGTLDGIYFRLQEASSKRAAEETMLFLASDYTDGKQGERSIYYYLPAHGDVDLEAMSLIMGHEVAHAALGHGKFDAPTQPKEQATFAAACETLRKSTLQEAADNRSAVTSGLERLKRYYSPKKFAPAYDTVVKAIENGTFGTLPVRSDLVPAGEAQQCTLQDPWQAFMQQVRSRNINGGELGPEMQTEEFETVVNDLVKEWHEMLMGTSIQQALTEDSYLSKPPIEPRFGGSYENQSELTAITLGLALRVPEAYGGKVAQLSPGQKTALLSVAEANREKVKALHPDNPNFHKYVDQQYRKFFAAAHHQ